VAKKAGRIQVESAFESPVRICILTRDVVVAASFTPRPWQGPIHHQRALPFEGTSTEETVNGLASTWTVGLRLSLVTENCLFAATFRLALGPIQCVKWDHFSELSDESVKMTTYIHVYAPTVFTLRYLSAETTQPEEVTAALMTILVFWNVTPCRLVHSYQLPKFRRDVVPYILILLCSIVYFPYLSDFNWRLRSSGMWCRVIGWLTPTTRDSVLVSYSSVDMSNEVLTLEDETTMLSRNVRHQWSSAAAPHPRRTEPKKFNFRYSLN
jgi:hypothetical protein